MIGQCREWLAERLLIWATWVHPSDFSPGILGSDPSLSRRFNLELVGPDWKTPTVMFVSLIPASGELGFAWFDSGVGWTITLAELLTVFERSGYVDPFKGECSPHAKAPGAQAKEAKPGCEAPSAQAGLEGRRDA